MHHFTLCRDGIVFIAAENVHGFTKNVKTAPLLQICDPLAIAFGRTSLHGQAALRAGHAGVTCHATAEVGAQGTTVASQRLS